MRAVTSAVLLSTAVGAALAGAQTEWNDWFQAKTAAATRALVFVSCTTRNADTPPLLAITSQNEVQDLLRGVLVEEHDLEVMRGRLGSGAYVAFEFYRAEGQPALATMVVFPDDSLRANVATAPTWASSEFVPTRESWSFINNWLRNRRLAFPECAEGMGHTRVPAAQLPASADGASRRR